MVFNLIRGTDWLLLSSNKIKPIIRNHGTSPKIFTAMMKLTKKGPRKVKHGYSDVDDNFLNSWQQNKFLCLNLKVSFDELQ